jgi:hypothetical protein
VQKSRYSTLLLALAAAAYLLVQSGVSPTDLLRDAGFGGSSQSSESNAAILSAYETKRSNLVVEGEGRVVAVLPDDNRGSRHQRFIVEVAPDRTILISHNIDLAPRVAGIRKGDKVAFRGEYEWNEKGGVVHWTHHDPRGRRAGGWIERNGRRFK